MLSINYKNWLCGHSSVGPQRKKAYDQTATSKRNDVKIPVDAVNCGGNDAPFRAHGSQGEGSEIGRRFYSMAGKAYPYAQGY